jgi:hypothetical protein
VSRRHRRTRWLANGLHLEGSFEGESFLPGDVEAGHDSDRSTMHTFFTADAGPLMAFPGLGRRLRAPRSRGSKLVPSGCPWGPARDR